VTFQNVIAEIHVALTRCMILEVSPLAPVGTGNCYRAAGGRRSVIGQMVSPYTWHPMPRDPVAALPLSIDPPHIGPWPDSLAPIPIYRRSIDGHPAIV